MGKLVLKGLGKDSASEATIKSLEEQLEAANKQIKSLETKVAKLEKEKKEAKKAEKAE